jgi:hypothetical protein
MRDELKAETLAKGGHFRHWHHVASLPRSTTTCVSSIMVRRCRAVEVA